MLKTKDFQSIQLTQVQNGNKLSVLAKTIGTHGVKTYLLQWSNVQDALSNKQNLFKSAFELQYNNDLISKAAPLDSKITNVLVSGGWVNGQTALAGHFERTGKIISPCITDKENTKDFTINLPVATTSYIPEIEQAYYFINGLPVATFPILDLTYDTKDDSGIKDSNYILGAAELNLDAESKYTIQSIKTGISVEFNLTKDNNFGLQRPIKDILKKSGVPNFKKYTGLFAPGCLPKTEIIKKLSTIDYPNHISVSKTNLGSEQKITTTQFQFIVNRTR